MNKKNLFLWSLYDFANSLIYINFILYFAQWLVLDGGLSDSWYNAIFAIVTVLLLFSAPALAAYTDRNGGRKFFLNFSTIGTFLSYTLAIGVAFLGTGYVILAALFFLIGQYFYQLSFVFYNSMLEEVANISHRSSASGIGQFSNALGQVVGVAMTLPFADSRLLPLVIATGVFIVLSLPMMLYFKEDRKWKREGAWLKEVGKDTKEFLRRFKIFFAMSASIPMLFALFFFSDALITLSNNFALVVERVYGASDTMKSLLLMAILAMSAVGGIVAGWLGDRIGVLTTLKFILVGWVIAIPFLSLAPTFNVFAAVSIPVGLLIGSAYAVSRAYLSTLLPKEDMTYGFSYYTLMERFSTFVGPLTWGGILVFMGANETGYRTAVAAMTVFMLIGLLILIFYKRNSTYRISSS